MKGIDWNYDYRMAMKRIVDDMINQCKNKRKNNMIETLNLTKCDDEKKRQNKTKHANVEFLNGGFEWVENPKISIYSIIFSNKEDIKKLDYNFDDYEVFIVEYAGGTNQIIRVKKEYYNKHFKEE